MQLPATARGLVVLDSCEVTSTRSGSVVCSGGQLLLTNLPHRLGPERRSRNGVAHRAEVIASVFGDMDTNAELAPKMFGPHQMGKQLANEFGHRGPLRFNEDGRLSGGIIDARLTGR